MFSTGLNPYGGLRTSRLRGPQKSPIFGWFTLWKRLKYPQIFARLRRVWDPKNDRFTSQNHQYTPKFSRAFGAQRTLFMTDLPRGNLKIPYLWARRRRENFGVLPWFSREIPIESAKREQNFLAAEGGPAQKGPKSSKIWDFWEIWDFLTRGGLRTSPRRGGLWPGTMVIEKY